MPALTTIMFLGITFWLIDLYFELVVRRIRKLYVCISQSINILLDRSHLIYDQQMTV